MSKKAKKKKGAAAAKDQEISGDEQLSPAPDAISAAAPQDAIKELSDDIEAMDMKLLEYAYASSLTPEQRQHALRILVARAGYEDDALQATPAQI